jgi:hypothetical protein
MLKEAIETIQAIAQQAAIGSRDPHMVVDGTHYIYDDAKGSYVLQADVWRHYEFGSPVVLTVHSLLEWCRTVADHGDKGVVVLSRRNTSYAQAPAWILPAGRRFKATMNFFSDYMPPAHALDPHTFRGWLDQLGEGLKDREAVLAEVNSLVASSGKTLKVRMTGAVVQVVGEDKSDVQGTMRRTVHATIPFGDPTFRADVSFLVDATCDKNHGLQLKAEHLKIDSAHDAWLEYARETAQDLLPDGWTLLLGP